MNNNYGIYVHIPFCKARCGYCAFSSCVDFNLCDNYIDCLCREIENCESGNAKITTMFWGGGTPSSVSVRLLQKLYAALSGKFDLSHLREFTVECNPESADQEMLTFLKGIGVNRLSFGLQSANNATLSRIGRLHNYSDFLRALDLARLLGFANINADLILGLPESESDFNYTVKTVSDLPLKHISLYALEVHEGTAFSHLCSKYAFSDDKLTDMYDYARSVFAERGFNRYEVSNFAKSGYECAHNLVYWTENRYFGFGASACGFVEHSRYGNVYDIKEYIRRIESGGSARDYTESVSRQGEMKEYVMLQLRLQKGFSIDEFRSRFGCEFFESFEKAADLLNKGFLSSEGGRVFVPDDKFYVLNSILVELLPD